MEKHAFRMILMVDEVRTEEVNVMISNGKACISDDSDGG
jgi:hypothetical protein